MSLPDFIKWDECTDCSTTSPIMSFFIFGANIQLIYETKDKKGKIFHFDDRIFSNNGQMTSRSTTSFDIDGSPKGSTESMDCS